MFIFYLSESLRQLCVFKKIEKRSIPWHCTLTIGSSLSIKIVAYKSVGGTYTFLIFKFFLFLSNLCTSHGAQIHSSKMKSCMLY